MKNGLFLGIALGTVGTVALLERRKQFFKRMRKND
jgi:hypothetical protein